MPPGEKTEPFFQDFFKMQITYTNTVEHTAAWHEQEFKNDYVELLKRRKIALVTGLSAAVVIFTGFTAFLIHSKQYPAPEMALFIIMQLAFTGIFYWQYSPQRTEKVLKRAAARTFREYFVAGAPVTLEIAGSGLRSKNRWRDQEISWKNIEKIVSGNGYIFIYLKNGTENPAGQSGFRISYVLHESAVQTGDYQAFIAELRRRAGNKFRRVR